MVNFSDLDISQLHKIVKIYNLETRIIPKGKQISKMSKNELAAEIDKHLELREDKIYYRQKDTNFAIPKKSKSRKEPDPNAPVRPKKPTKGEIIEQLTQRINELEKIIKDLQEKKPEEIIKEYQKKGNQRRTPEKIKQYNAKQYLKRKMKNKPEVERPEVEPPKETKKTIEEIKDELYNKRYELRDLMDEKYREINKKYEDKIKKANSEGNYILKDELVNQQREEEEAMYSVIGKQLEKVNAQIKDLVKNKTVEKPPKEEKFEPTIGFETIRKKIYSIAKKNNIKQYIELLKNKKMMKELKRIYEGGDLKQLLKITTDLIKKENDPEKRFEYIKRHGLFNAVLSVYNKLSKNPDEIIVEF